VTAEAGVAKVGALHEATRDREPGFDPLWAAATAYHDTVLADRAVRAILLAARSEPALAEEAQRASHDPAEVAVADFAALGHQHPAACAA